MYALLLLIIWPFNHLQAKERPLHIRVDNRTHLRMASCDSGYRLGEFVQSKSFGPPTVSFRLLNEKEVPFYRQSQFGCFRSDLKKAPR